MQIYLDYIANETLLNHPGKLEKDGWFGDCLRKNPFLKDHFRSATYKSEIQTSVVVWQRVLGRVDLTTLLLAYGRHDLFNVEIFKTEDVINGARNLELNAPEDQNEVWDLQTVMAILYPTLLDYHQVNQSWFLTEDNPDTIQYLIQAYQGQRQLFFIRENWTGILTNHNTRPIYLTFKEFIYQTPQNVRETWPFWRALEREKREKEEAEKRSKAQRQLFLIAEQQPHLAMFIDPRCPDWLVEIYRKAFLKAVAPRAQDETFEMRGKLTAVFNCAYDKIKENRGAAWNPEQLPWEKKKGD